MILKTILVLLTLVSVNCYAQFGPQQIITTDAPLASAVFAADIDGDNDMDILSAARSITGNNIAWYENLDGLGDFSDLILIDDSLTEAYSIFAADLDGDDDMDVLSVSANLDLVVWYENLDGQGNFGGRQIISSNAVGASSAIAVDIDNDGDMDIISASDFSGLAWYENTDGQGTFSAEITISNTVNNNRSVFAGDLDGDDDLDLVINASGADRLLWFENLDGLGNFGPAIAIAPTTLYPNTVFCVDVDMDTDLDILTVIPASNIVAWHENLDGLGNFGTEQIISTAPDAPWSAYGVDLDDDNDIDVLSASAGDNRIAWYENLDGQGTFGPIQDISTNAVSARSVIASDIDNDGDMDVLSASQNDDKIAWYENLTIFGLEDHIDSNLVIYPNPSSDLIYIDSKIDVITRIEIYNLLGEKLRYATNNVEQIDIADFQAGIYILKVHAENSMTTKKIIKK